MELLVPKAVNRKNHTNQVQSEDRHKNDADMKFAEKTDRPHKVMGDSSYCLEGLRIEDLAIQHAEEMK